MTVQAAERMLAALGTQYTINPDTGCWDYTGKKPTGQNKRPIILMGSKGTTAGRVICCVACGDPPSTDHQAGHSCHNGDCINPSHFRWEHKDDNQVSNKTGLPVGIRRRSGPYEAHIKKGGVHHYKSFWNLDEAVAWRNSFG